MTQYSVYLPKTSVSDRLTESVTVPDLERLEPLKKTFTKKIMPSMKLEFFSFEVYSFIPTGMYNISQKTWRINIFFKIKLSTQTRAGQHLY